MPEATMSVLEAHEALDEVLREERKVLTQAQEQVNAINAKREQAMQDLRQAIANESQNSKQPKQPKRTRKVVVSRSELSRPASKDLQ